MDFAKAPYPGGDMMLAYPEWFKAGVAPRPSKGRKYFTVWNYFTKDAPLVPSGLLGPVGLLTCGMPNPVGVADSPHSSPVAMWGAE